MNDNNYNLVWYLLQFPGVSTNLIWVSLDRDVSNDGEHRIHIQRLVHRGISIGENSTSNEEAPIPYHISGRRVSIAVPNNMMPQSFNYDTNTERFVRPRRTRRSSIGALAAPSKVSVLFTLTITNVTVKILYFYIYLYIIYI